MLKPKKSGACGEFFAVSREAWWRVCDLGLNAGIAYLVLARGSGSDNQTTRWSCNSVERYAGLSRGRAKAAVQKLLEAKMIECLLAESTVLAPKQRPTYLLTSGLLQGLPASTITDRSKDETPSSKDWIWLPNALVDGAANETPPLQLVRQTSETLALRLLVELYHHQNLCEHGGIDSSVLSQTYNSENLGDADQFEWVRYDLAETYMGLPVECSALAGRDGLTAGPDDPHGLTDEVQSRCYKKLITLGLIEWVPHLFESAQMDAEVVYSFETDGSSSAEQSLGDKMSTLALVLVNSKDRHHGTAQRSHTVLVPRHIEYADLRGVARLRYRPRTKLTTAWFTENEKRCEKYFVAASKILDRVTFAESATSR